MVYELLSHMGVAPEWAAILAGFAIYWWGELHITSAGERYLRGLR